ncbi:MAG: hypothetical protein QF898_10505 [SAR202 cluster bacterium]|nr:hypothetical protein [SAR202 cluster bacterium]
MTLTVEDGHSAPIVLTHDVNVNNATPTLFAGVNKTIFEGSSVGLGIVPPNLINNASAESGVSGWSGAGFTTRPYAPATDPSLADLGVFGPNLVINGGLETIPDLLSGWTDDLDVAVTGNPPTATHYPAVGSGRFLFAPNQGGLAAETADGPRAVNADSSGNQLIGIPNSTSLLDLIDEGSVNYDFSALLGGSGADDDTATLEATFLDALGGAISATTIGPVTAADRGETLSLLPRSTSGAVPPGTRSMNVELNLEDTDDYVFANEDPNGTWTLLATDTTADAPLCTQGFSVTVGDEWWTSMLHSPRTGAVTGTYSGPTVESDGNTQEIPVTISGFQGRAINVFVFIDFLKTADSCTPGLGTLG